MKCNSCEAEIPPSFVKALEKNSCPACEGPIMSEDSIELMAGLKNALEQMPNDPQGIAGWLLSNYRMQKVGTGEPTGFYGVNKSKSSVNEAELKIRKNPLQKFKEKIEQKSNVPNFKDLVAEINGQYNAEDDSDDVAVSEGEDDYVPEAEDPEFTKQALKSMMNTPGKQHYSPNKHLDEEESDANNSVFGDMIPDLHPALHQDRLERLAKQKEIGHGGVGIIKRTR